MSLIKSASSFPSPWYLQAGFRNKRIGAIHLKNKLFEQTLLDAQSKYDDVLNNLANCIKTIVSENLASFPDIPLEKKETKKSKKASKQQQLLEMTDSEDGGFSSDEVEDEEEEAVPVKTRKSKAPKKAVKKNRDF